jgi:hypothetical protein
MTGDIDELLMNYSPSRRIAGGAGFYGINLKATTWCKYLWHFPLVGLAPPGVTNSIQQVTGGGFFAPWAGAGVPVYNAAPPAVQLAVVTACNKIMFNPPAAGPGPTAVTFAVFPAGGFMLSFYSIALNEGWYTNAGVLHGGARTGANVTVTLQVVNDATNAVVSTTTVTGYNKSGYSLYVPSGRHQLRLVGPAVYNANDVFYFELQEFNMVAGPGLRLPLSSGNLVTAGTTLGDVIGTLASHEVDALFDSEVIKRVERVFRRLNTSVQNQILSVLTTNYDVIKTDADPPVANLQLNWSSVRWWLADTSSLVLTGTTLALQKATKQTLFQIFFQMLRHTLPMLISHETVLSSIAIDMDKN